MINPIITSAIILSAPPTFTALLSLRRSNKNGDKIKEIHLLINSRMDDLLKAAKGEATAEGREIGRNERR